MEIILNYNVDWFYKKSKYLIEIYIEQEELMAKIKNVTTYKGIAKFYFEKIIETIINIGDLKVGKKTILDFGCGHGVLKKKLPNINVINYDIIQELSDIVFWNKYDFDFVVANTVFYTFSSDELEQLLCDFKNKNPRLRLIVGMSRQSILNKIGKNILGFSDAHDGTLLRPQEELNVLKKYMEIINHK